MRVSTQPITATAWRLFWPGAPENSARYEIADAHYPSDFIAVFKIKDGEKEIFEAQEVKKVLVFEYDLN